MPPKFPSSVRGAFLLFLFQDNVDPTLSTTHTLSSLVSRLSSLVSRLSSLVSRLSSTETTKIAFPLLIPPHAFFNSEPCSAHLRSRYIFPLSFSKVFQNRPRKPPWKPKPTKKRVRVGRVATGWGVFIARRKFCLRLASRGFV
jgi:hypothetical protein